MAKYLSRKTLCYRLLIPIAVAGSILAFLLHARAGPVLGAEYDFLARFRPSPPVAREILIIETGAGAEQVLAPALAAQVALSLTEFSASKLIILSPLLGVHKSGSGGGSELVFRVDEEFKTINGNITNLFEGIRMGSISPQDAPRFVSEVLRLTAQSKERLLFAAVQSLEADELRMEKAFAVFAGVRIPADIQIALAGSAAEKTGMSALYASGYSRTAADSDGKIRRIVPFVEGAESSEHVVWAALKDARDDNSALRALLDRSPALIFEMPQKDAGFRTIPLSLFIEYEELDTTINSLLAADPSLSGYAGILPDAYPAFLYQKAMELCEDLLETNEDDQKARWIKMREQYALALTAFFADGIRQNIVQAFENLAQEEKLGEDGTQKLAVLRDEELRKYDIAREVYREFALIRVELEEALRDSFCILGADAGGDGNTDGAAGGSSSPARLSALLANTLLTGAAISTAGKRDVIIRSLLPALLLALIMLRLRILASTVIMALVPLALYVFFAYSFIFSGLWLDPVIPAASVFAAAFASLLCAIHARMAMAARIRLDFGEAVSARYLRVLIAAKKALPPQNMMMKAVIVAVRSKELSSGWAKGDAQAAAQKLKQFYTEVKTVFTGRGAVLTGFTDDTVLAAFGSPLERFVQTESGKPAPYNGSAEWERLTLDRAARLIRELAGRKNADERWVFGLDFGGCHFSWPAPAGYAAAGRPVAYARLLARLCSRYKTTVLLTKAAASVLEPALIKKTSTLIHGKRRSLYTLS